MSITHFHQIWHAYVWAHSKDTHGGIVPLGGTILEQNMKLPLTTIEYYDIKCYILQMHWCTITNFCMYHRYHDLNVLKKFWDSATLWSKVIMKRQINANSFLWILPIVMRPEDSLVHAENSVAIVSQTSCPPFWFSLKTYCFELLLDRLSDLNQNLIISSSDHADKNWGLMPKWHCVCISEMLWHIDTKLGVCHCQLTQNTPHWFDNSATYWPNMISQ